MMIGYNIHTSDNTIVLVNFILIKKIALVISKKNLRYGRPEPWKICDYSYQKWHEKKLC